MSLRSKFIGYYDRGMEKYMLRDYEAAAICLSKALYLMPNDHKVMIALARMYIQIGDFEVKHELLICQEEKAYKLKLDLPCVVLDEFASLLDAQGYHLLLKKKYLKAIPLMNEAIAINSTRTNFYLHRVLCFIALKLFVKGLKDVDQALALDGGNAMFYILRAKLRWKLGFIQKGNQDVLTAYNIDPKNKEANQYHYLLQNESLREYDMACSSILERKYDKALQHISQAESIDADDTKILQTKAIILRKLKRTKEAYATINKIVSASMPPSCDGSVPDSLRQKNLILHDQAIQLMRDKQFLSALDLLNKIIEVESTYSSDKAPISPLVYLNRGDCFRELKKNHAAIADYHGVLDRDATNKEAIIRISVVHTLLGMELFNTGHYDTAEVEFSYAIQYHPHAFKYYVYRAEAALYQQKIHQAVSDYQIAIRLNPNDTSIQKRIAMFQKETKTPSIQSPLKPPQLLKPKPSPSKMKRSKVQNLMIQRCNLSRAYKL